MKKMVVVLFVFLSVNLYSQNNSNQSASGSIMDFAAISVTIGGQFPINGTFPALITDRADQFITRIYSLAVDRMKPTVDNMELLNQAKFDLENFSLRGIKLKRSDGTEMILDLLKFRTTGDLSQNPFLKNSDVIIFPPFDIDRNFISISGAVNNPGRFLFVNGDRLSDIITLAQGVHAAYEKIENVVISRLNYDGEQEVSLSYKISDNPMLEIGDRIVVVSEETYKRDFRVNIIGEVNNPGKYPISKGSTTLREVIQKVGGFKQSADLNRAELIRGVNVFKNVFFNDNFERIMMLRMANITEEDSLSFAIDNELRFLRGNGILDFTELMNENSVDGDFVVKDGDLIIIPEKINLVYIFGQVKTPGYVEYRSQFNVYDYINKAGGLGAIAKEEIYLIKGKSRTWLKVEEDVNLHIEAGDYIWIPKEIPKTFNYYLSQISSIAAVVGAVATVVLVFLQATK